jgi:hypothetical protein
MKVFASAKDELAESRKDKARNKTADKTWMREISFIDQTSECCVRILTHLLKIHTLVIVEQRKIATARKARFAMTKRNNLPFFRAVQKC